MCDVQKAYVTCKMSLFGRLKDLFHDFWDRLGYVWEHFGDGLGWIGDEFGKMFREFWKIQISRSVREYFPCNGLLKTVVFLTTPGKQTLTN